jgi:hypothetical protein
MVACSFCGLPASDVPLSQSCVEPHSGICFDCARLAVAVCLGALRDAKPGEFTLCRYQDVPKALREAPLLFNWPSHTKVLICGAQEKHGLFACTLPDGHASYHASIMGDRVAWEWP